LDFFGFLVSSGETVWEKPPGYVLRADAREMTAAVAIQAQTRSMLRRLTMRAAVDVAKQGGNAALFLRQASAKLVDAGMVDGETEAMQHQLERLQRKVGEWVCTCVCVRVCTYTSLRTYVCVCVRLCACVCVGGQVVGGGGGRHAATTTARLDGRGVM
jgi:hypothetical protein